MGQGLRYRRWRDHDRRLYLIQDGICYLCGRRIAPPGNLTIGSRTASLDHVFPRRGARVSYSSGTLLVHSLCNTIKADRDPYACEIMWLRHVEERERAMMRKTTDG